jgi:hypothetical protein
MGRLVAVVPACPRCGYDQSGAIAAWERNDPACCPLRGTCSECGEEFEWSQVFRPGQRWPIVPFESADHRLVASALVTVWRALRPWSFWTWVEPHAVPRWSRILPCVLCGVLVVHLVGVLVYAVAGQLALWIDPEPGFGFYNCHTTGWLRSDIWVGLWPWGQPPGMDVPPEYSQPLLSPAAAISFTAIAFIMIGAVSMHVATNRYESPTRVARIAVYGFIGAPLPHVLALACAASLAVFEAMETRIARDPEISWEVRTFLYDYGVYASIALAIGWWLSWWGFAGARCLKWRRPWLTILIIAALSCFCVFLVFVSIEPLRLWTSRFWRP